MRSVGESAPRLGQSRLQTAAALAAVVIALAGCGEDRRRADGPALNAGGVQLPPDAEDPTARNARLGYGPWKAAPEAEGTREPTH